MNGEEIKELSSLITKKVVVRILMKLDEIEVRENSKIKLWDYNDENMSVFGELEDGRTFEEKI